ncbi:ribonuclease H-like domain-containing protein, partial [Tanacetum coccineum]
SAGTKGPIPPKIAEQKLARKNELKAKSTLLLAISDENLLKFYSCKDAKSLWEAIKNRFQKLISQLELHGEIITQEDTNMKLLKSLPSAWNNIALIMRSKPELETLSIDDLYNNLKVYESKIKGQSNSNSNSLNVAFVSSDNSSSTNEAVNTASSVYTASVQTQASTSTYVDDVMFSFFVNQFNSPQLDNEDLEQIDANDLKEMDLKWQVAMLTTRVKRFINKTGRKLDLNGKETIGFDKIKVECYNCHRRGHFARECRAPRNQRNRNRDALRRNAPAEEGPTDFSLMAYTTQSSSSSDTENIHVNESEVVHSVFKSRESDVDDNIVNVRFKIGEGFHTVPLPYTGNYMTPRPNLSFAGLDESVFKSAERKTTTTVPETKTSISKTNKNIVEKPRTIRPSAPIIED